MRDILPDIQRWLEEDRSIALATVIQTWGSSPRGVGSKMAFTPDGKISGSVSGGCVENAVIDAGIRSLKMNWPQLLQFGVADETAWEVGLACGGSIDVFVEPLDKIFFAELCAVIEKDQRAVTGTIVRGPTGILGRQFLMLNDDRVTNLPEIGRDQQILNLASEVLSQGMSRRVALSEELEVFFEAILPPPMLIVIGGVHIAVTLTSLAKTLGYRTILVDPRKAWGNKDRFPNVDQLIQLWPEDALGQLNVSESTAVAVLTHDPKVDDPALKIALSSPAFYIGALGSQSTNAKRLERLIKEGVSKAQLSRLRAPIGLDIGAQSPEEIALAIMAEVVEVYRKRVQQTAESAA